MEDKLRKNTQKRNKNRINHVQNYAKRSVFFPIATENLTKKSENFVRQTCGKTDNDRQTEVKKLIFAVHLFKQTRRKRFSAVVDAHNRPLCRKRARRLGKARNF